MKHDLNPLIVILFLIVGILIGMVAGASFVINHERSLAMEAGVGCWVIDKASGNRSFVYGSPR